MAKYEITFSCGHTETRDLVGKGTDRARKIEYFERYGLCSCCYNKQKEAEIAKDFDEVEMSYRDYKNNYPDCKTKKDSYNASTKTIVVYVPNDALYTENKQSETDKAAKIENNINKIEDAIRAEGDTPCNIKYDDTSYTSPAYTEDIDGKASPIDSQWLLSIGVNVHEFKCSYEIEREKNYRKH